MGPTPDNIYLEQPEGVAGSTNHPALNSMADTNATRHTTYHLHF